MKGKTSVLIEGLQVICVCMGVINFFIGLKGLKLKKEKKENVSEGGKH